MNSRERVMNMLENRPVQWQRTMDRSDWEPLCYERWLTTVVGQNQRGKSRVRSLQVTGRNGDSMSPRENLVRVLRRDHPGWVPNGLEGRGRILPPVVERPGEEGRDAFGVHWSYLEAAEGGTYPTQGRAIVTDIGKWREQMKIPDVATLD
jgi:hypothetical protein